MRRIQIYLDEEVDDALQEEAARRGVSKAALVRGAVAKEFKPVPPPDSGWEGMIGWLNNELVDESIDETLYGPTRD